MNSLQEIILSTEFSFCLPAICFRAANIFKYVLFEIYRITHIIPDIYTMYIILNVQYVRTEHGQLVLIAHLETYYTPAP